MNTPLWLTELANDFWKRAGGATRFPRDLLRAVPRAALLSVKPLADLSVQRVSTWLRLQGIVCSMAASERALHACLFARYDCGFIFLDASDDEAEQRFSLAHELAHFLRHYQEPRQRAAAKFGRQILEVLDGKRPPTYTERLHALLRHVRVHEHVHLLTRDDRHRIPSPALAAAEFEADRLGCQLLAPAEMVWRLIPPEAGRAARGEAERQLQLFFGLPSRNAAWYANQLYPSRDDPLLQRLRISS